MDETFGSWLRVQIERLYPSQAEFARRIGSGPQLVNNWVLDKNIPEIENLTAIARAIGADVYTVARRAGVELPGAAPQPRSPEDILAELEANQPVAVPVIRDLVAHMGSGGGFIDDYVFLSPMYRRRRKKNLLSIVARGNCMEPQIADGDVVVFDRDAAWQPNNLVVAAVDGQAQVRRFVDVRGTPMLKADADGSLHTLGEADQIFGRVVYVMRPLMPLDESA